MNVAKIEKIVSSVEEVLLDGEKYPNGRTSYPDEEKARVKFAAPRIVKAYEMAQKSEAPEEFLGRIYYLARDIRKRTPHIPYVYTEVTIEDSVLSERLREIANEGRELSLANPKTVEERVQAAKLFAKGDDVFAAQVQDPKRGCSASICTNCDEPIAFCRYVCYICNYELIGAHGMPTINEWNQMGVDMRKEKLLEGYLHMMDDICQRGDWRGIDSPLNRFKPKNVNWGSCSGTPGGMPLTRIGGIQW